MRPSNEAIGGRCNAPITECESFELAFSMDVPNFGFDLNFNAPLGLESIMIPGKADTDKEMRSLSKPAELSAQTFPLVIEAECDLGENILELPECMEVSYMEVEGSPERRDYRVILRRGHVHRQHHCSLGCLYASH